MSKPYEYEIIEKKTIQIKINDCMCGNSDVYAHYDKNEHNNYFRVRCLECGLGYDVKEVYKREELRGEAAGMAYVIAQWNALSRNGSKK